MLFGETVDGTVGLQLWMYKNEAGQDNLKKKKKSKQKAPPENQTKSPIYPLQKTPNQTKP